MKDFLNGLFQFNEDCKCDIFERPGKFAAFLQMIESEEADEDDELEAAGLDRIELEYMDETERREALEDAGLDPDDYDL